MKHIFYHIVLLSAICMPLKSMSQCEPWCQGEGGYYITYNAYPHSLWWHRHQKQEVYKEPSLGRFFDKRQRNNIVPIATPPSIESNTQYYYGSGIFYIYNQGGYVAVPAPIGYTVPDIPPSPGLPPPRRRGKNAIQPFRHLRQRPVSTAIPADSRHILRR